MAGLTLLVCVIPCFFFLPWGLIPVAFIILVAYALFKDDDFYEAHPRAIAVLGTLTAGIGAAMAVGVISHAGGSSSNSWGGFFEALFWLMVGVPIFLFCLVDSILLFMRLWRARRKAV